MDIEVQATHHHLPTDLQFELSKEHMEDPYDVFLQLKGVVTPALGLHKPRSP